VFFPWRNLIKRPVLMDVISTDVAITGTGGAGFRAAIAVAEVDPSLNLCLLSKVYPMSRHQRPKVSVVNFIEKHPGFIRGPNCRVHLVTGAPEFDCFVVAAAVHLVTGASTNAELTFHPDQSMGGR
jgi:hypothetical protein